MGMLLSVLAVLPALPIRAEEARLTVEKTTFAVGEPIPVTAVGSGADWVGLYCAEDTYDPNAGGVASIYWYYVAKDGNASGETVDLYQADYNNFSTRPEFAAGLPAGSYRIVLMENDGYRVLDSVEITLVADGETAEDRVPTESEPLVTSKSVYAEGEPILVRAIGSGDQWVGIYKSTDTPGAIGSIYWYYVDRDGYTSGEEVSIKDTTPPGEHQAPYRELPAGAYKLILFADGGYTVRAEVAITVEGAPSSEPTAPASATYTSADAGKGRADGRLTITHDGNAPASYVLRWANASGPIKDYTDIATVSCTGKTTEYTLTPNTLIPVGADRILVYAARGDSLSDSPAIAMLPHGAGEYELGEVHQEFQVMSDIHINDDEGHPYNQQFISALREITRLSPDTLGVFINGDIADLGLSSNYAAYRRILRSAGRELEVYAAMGNHDFYCHKYGGPNLTDKEKIAQFMAGTGNDSETVYFDRWIDGTHFVFLGSEAYVPPNAQLSEEQLSWLEQTLDADRAAGRPVFLFLHEGIMDTVAGTFEYQGWHGVEQGRRLKEIIDAHPEVVMFSGHSHWVLESPVTLLPGNGTAATHVSTASCAYLWDDNANITNVGINGSQGYYIYLYDDCIVLRGRSFSSGEWISSAQFVLDWDFGDAWGSEPEESLPAETLPETRPAPESETPAPLPPQTTPDTEAPASSESLPTDASESPSESAPASEGGCSSLVTAGTLAGLLAGGVLLHRRRRHEAS